MQIVLRNINQLWAYTFTETLKHLGLTSAVICPGSRSTPLAVAFSQQVPEIEAISILDERSAAFFALGQAKAAGRPVVIVCTSGTAGANFYPAIIEARESRVPLLVCTADRPQELRDCHSGQTIDQSKLYGNYPNWQAELALPAADMGMLSYLRQMVIYAWERCQTPTQGPVHLNMPFRDPLAPVVDGENEVALKRLYSQFHSEKFFNGIRHSIGSAIVHPQISIFPEWQQCDRGIIIAGVEQPQKPQEYCQAIAKLSQTLQWPVIAEGLSPVRNYANINPYLISTYDLILRNPRLAKQLGAEMVIQVGEMPTSKELRNWVSATQPRRWVINPSNQNLDPLHGRTTHLRISIEQLTEEIRETEKSIPVSDSEYIQLWCRTEAQVRAAVDQTMKNIQEPFEGKAAWLISQSLPPKTPIFIANSMPVRDVEFFWKPSHSEVRPYFNRGANGIDGTLSTALGITHRHQSSVMLTGDLALLHDTNGFLLRNKLVGHLTIVLINNNGGGIFEMLPIAEFNPPFEEFFATPQDINFAQLCATYGVTYELINSWEQFQLRLNPLPTKGIRVLELSTNRQQDAKWRRENLAKFSTDIS